MNRKKESKKGYKFLNDILKHLQKESTLALAKYIDSLFTDNEWAKLSITKNLFLQNILDDQTNTDKVIKSLESKGYIIISPYEKKQGIDNLGYILNESIYKMLKTIDSNITIEIH